ncbi:hypothetical protein ACJRO7_024129 [Eucalyptus globulus]|uniref:Uncharacterized protein n=1 Tax=Eucalyptus globulus TaxID=34317 RepID=A0ABD3K9L6_EUCGL
MGNALCRGGVAYKSILVVKAFRMTMKVRNEWHVCGYGYGGRGCNSEEMMTTRSLYWYVIGKFHTNKRVEQPCIMGSGTIGSDVGLQSASDEE